jgi:hypothetical protein
MSLFCRGWLQVLLVSSNVVFVSHGMLVPSVVGGFLISALWWRNAHSAAHVSTRWAGLAYASGAAAGTWSGLTLAAWLRAVL